jgi:hypothetical protein
VIGSDPLLFPTLGVETQALVRVLYGALMLLMLTAALPHWRRYFVTERWGGYTKSSGFRDVVQHPAAIAVWLAVWLIAIAGLIVGRAVVAAAAINLVSCYYFFNRLRWASVSRGAGAPGFIALWLAAATFLLELTTRHAPAARGLSILALQIDFGAIMLSAGLYKLAAGYRQRHGMELGMVNPEWGYWPSFWKAWPPTHAIFGFFNEMAWTTEVVCGAMMLLPPTRMLGGLGIFLSFIFIASQIRLGFLSEMVMVCCILFIPAGSLIDGWIVSLGLPINTSGEALPQSAQTFLTVGLWIYIALLPLARAGMFYNQLRHRSLPSGAQRALDLYTNAFGLILWRVFTADVVNFFVRIWEQPAVGARRLISEFHRTGPSRFSQVAECIALTSVFTTLKYYPTNTGLFEERLFRYARTIARERTSQLVFEWVKVEPRADHFDYVPAAEFVIDSGITRVTETVLDPTISVREVPGVSPVHEGARPGSYAPLKS